MKSSDITLGDVLAYQKNSYGGTNAVLALDNKLWTLGLAWVADPKTEGARIQVNAFRQAEKGAKAGTRGSYGLGYKETGIPVLKIDHGHYNWTTEAESRIVTSAQDILRTAAKQLGNVESAEDMVAEQAKGTRAAWRTEVEALNVEGKKVSIVVHLEVVRPQTLKTAWNTFLRDDEQARENSRKYREEKTNKEQAQRDAGTALAARLDALLGEQERHWGYGSVDRSDCYRDGSAFKVDEDTLMKLLALAEKGAAL